MANNSDMNVIGGITELVLLNDSALVREEKKTKDGVIYIIYYERNKVNNLAALHDGAKSIYGDNTKVKPFKRLVEFAINDDEIHISENWLSLFDNDIEMFKLIYQGEIDEEAAIGRKIKIKRDNRKKVKTNLKPWVETLQFSVHNESEVEDVEPNNELRDVFSNLDNADHEFPDPEPEDIDTTQSESQQSNEPNDSQDSHNDQVDEEEMQTNKKWLQWVLNAIKDINTAEEFNTFVKYVDVTNDPSSEITEITLEDNVKSKGIPEIAKLIAGKFVTSFINTDVFQIKAQNINSLSDGTIQCTHIESVVSLYFDIFGKLEIFDYDNILKEGLETIGKTLKIQSNKGLVKKKAGRQSKEVKGVLDSIYERYEQTRDRYITKFNKNHKKDDSQGDGDPNNTVLGSSPSPNTVDYMRQRQWMKKVCDELQDFVSNNIGKIEKANLGELFLYKPRFTDIEKIKTKSLYRIFQDAKDFLDNIKVTKYPQDQTKQTGKNGTRWMFLDSIMKLEDCLVKYDVNGSFAFDYEDSLFYANQLGNWVFTILNYGEFDIRIGTSRFGKMAGSITKNSIWNISNGSEELILSKDTNGNFVKNPNKFCDTFGIFVSCLKRDEKDSRDVYAVKQYGTIVKVEKKETIDEKVRFQEIDKQFYNLNIQSWLRMFYDGLRMGLEQQFIEEKIWSVLSGEKKFEKFQQSVPYIESRIYNKAKDDETLEKWTGKLWQKRRVELELEYGNYETITFQIDKLKTIIEDIQNNIPVTAITKNDSKVIGQYKDYNISLAGEDTGQTLIERLNESISSDEVNKQGYEEQIPNKDNEIKTVRINICAEVDKINSINKRANENRAKLTDTVDGAVATDNIVELNKKLNDLIKERESIQKELTDVNELLQKKRFTMSLLEDNIAEIKEQFKDVLEIDYDYISVSEEWNGECPDEDEILSLLKKMDVFDCVTDEQIDNIKDALDDYFDKDKDKRDGFHYEIRRIFADVIYGFLDAPSAKIFKLMNVDTNNFAITKQFEIVAKLIGKRISSPKDAYDFYNTWSDIRLDMSEVMRYIWNLDNDITCISDTISYFVSERDICSGPDQEDNKEQINQGIDVIKNIWDKILFQMEHSIKQPQIDLDTQLYQKLSDKGLDDVRTKFLQNKNSENSSEYTVLHGEYELFTVEPNTGNYTESNTEYKILTEKNILDYIGIHIERKDKDRGRIKQVTKTNVIYLKDTDTLDKHEEMSITINDFIAMEIRKNKRFYVCKPNKIPMDYQGEKKEFILVEEDCFRPPLIDSNVATNDYMKVKMNERLKVRLGSWNIACTNAFDTPKTIDELNIKFKNIAKIIQESKCSIIALQELPYQLNLKIEHEGKMIKGYKNKDDEVIQESYPFKLIKADLKAALLEAMPFSNWEIQSSNAFYGKDIFQLGDENEVDDNRIPKEVYAFVYNTKIVKYLHPNQEHTNKVDDRRKKEDRFARLPILSQFSSGNLQFYLCNVHLPPTAKKIKTSQEIKSLSDLVFPKLIELFGEKASKSVIFLGDFNMSYTRKKGFQPYPEVDTWETFYDADYVPCIKTQTNVLQNQCYDNIWMHSSLENLRIKSASEIEDAGVLKVNEVMGNYTVIGSTLREYFRKQVSDHNLVYIDLRTNETMPWSSSNPVLKREKA